MKTQEEITKRNTYFYRDIRSLQNGSCYRATGKKKSPYALYINGDFIDFVNTIPDSCEMFSNKVEIRHLLPASMR